MAKKRLDQVVVDRGLASSLDEAECFIRSGLIIGQHSCLDKPGTLIDNNAYLYKKQKERQKWVSRGALKLLKALSHWNLVLDNKVVSDIGASTGGFTDVLIHHGAKQVYAVDVAYGELAWSLRNHPRVKVLERLNAKYIKAHHFDIALDMIVCDLSFISVKQGLTKALSFVNKQAELIILIKPQFEAPKHLVPKGGIIKDPLLKASICDDISQWLDAKKGWCVIGVIASPILGKEGNEEFLLYAKYNRD